MADQKQIKVGIVGAAGRMGQALVRCVERFPRLTLAGAAESVENKAVGKDAGVVAGIASTGVIISSSVKEVAGLCDVLIDFTAPGASAANALVFSDMKKSVVIGTTGLNNEEASAVRKAAESVPVVWAPNMSKGVNLLFNIVEKAAEILSDYDIEIIETHHRHKKDAPSGTALRLVESAAAGRKIDPATSMVHGRDGQVGARPAVQIGVHAVRGGDVVGDHTVLLATEGERIELTHKASSRDCFAMGALQAAQWLAEKAPGLYNMQDVLDLAR